ncbi:hypothetical protein B9Z55_009556 [Caenorhabditis nigoni]|uniref:Uncharacterized protein n=1 Tax=Caenorhabditis nigoni TaxID=1611254 RepID=A0A2G5USI4_9PELO|nr:hypothetical protein B9Z55_009556 [Caenorhabditis nigoni]
MNDIREHSAYDKYRTSFNIMKYGSQGSLKSNNIARQIESVMGRKNKTKLLKHGSQSLNASTIIESDGRSSSNDSHQVEFEALSSQLREFVTSGSSPHTHKDVARLYSTLEKKDAELIVAKQLIKTLKAAAPSDHSGDGDSLFAIREDNFSEPANGHNCTNIIEELDRVTKQNDDLVKEREKLADQLNDTENRAVRLEAEVKSLEDNLDQTNRTLEEGRQTSEAVIGELKTSLMSASQTVETLQSDIQTHKSSYRTACSDLETVKERFVRQEKDMLQSVHLQKETSDKLEQAQQEISSLKAAMMKQNEDFSHSIHQLVSDREKLETRYDRINNGVQLIKKDFDEVKKNLVESNEKIKELQQQLASSKADVKHYRDNEEACRKYIKKLEENDHAACVLAKEAILELQEKYKPKMKLAEDQLSNQENSEDSLVKDLQEEFQFDGSINLVSAVTQLRENFKKEQRKQVFQSAALEGKDVAYQKLLKQNTSLLETISEHDAQRSEDGKIMKEEREKFQEELNALKKANRKLKKDKDHSLKRLKNLLAKNSDLLDHSKALEEKLNHSTHSASNESMVSVNSEALDSLEDSIKALKSTLESNENKLCEVSKQLVQKEEENLDLHRTVVAYKSKIKGCEQEHIKSQKQVSTMESRLAELQRSSDLQLKRCEEELSAVHEKLGSSDAALEVQQELNCKLNAHTEELKQKYDAESNRLEKEVSELMEKIALQESHKKQQDAFISDAEVKSCELSDKIKSLDAQLKTIQEKLDQQQKLSQEIEEGKMKVEGVLSSTMEEKQKLLEETERLTKKLKEFEESRKETESGLAKINHQLANEAEALRTQIMAQDLKIESLSSSRDKAVEDLLRQFDQKEKEYEKLLQSEKAKFEILGKRLEEKTEESSEKVRRLKEKEITIEELKVEKEKTLLETQEKVQQKENDLMKMVAEKASLESQVESFKLLAEDRQTEVEHLTKERHELALKQQNSETEMAKIHKQLQDALSPKKDKVLQLENRLEVIQTAAKAQNKRLEDELSSTMALLQLSTEKTDCLEKKIVQLQQQTDELQQKNIELDAELAKSTRLKEVVADLEKINKDIQVENAEERTGLVNELIDAKQKLAECETQISELQSHTMVRSDQTEVNQVQADQAHGNAHRIDTLFPSMDPAVRQLVILLSRNRNYSYGVIHDIKSDFKPMNAYKGLKALNVMNILIRSDSFSCQPDNVSFVLYVPTKTEIFMSADALGKINTVYHKNRNPVLFK